MHLFLILLNFLINIKFILSFYTYPSVKKYCRDSERLIVADKFDEYLLIDAELNTTLLLNCHFCGDPSDHQPRLWYYQARLQETEVREVQFDMNNNMSNNRIYLNSDLDLIIENFGTLDAGIYRCHGELGFDVEKKFNYRLEPVFQEFDADFIQRGNLSDWENYRQINLMPVSERFSVSRMPGLVLIRDSGVVLEVISVWSVWSSCGKCIKKYGVKTSRAQCRLKSHINSNALNTSQIVNFFNKSPLLPCRSHLLKEEFPIISKIIRNLPEFLLEKDCKKCTKLKPKKKGKFKYKKRFTLGEGAHLALTCPESDIDTKVVWRHDGKILKSGTTSLLLRKKKKQETHEARVYLDTFSTLYFVDVTVNEEGNYTCYVDGFNMMSVKVRVWSKGHLLTSALLRHMKYIGFVLFISSLCYCAGLVAICKNPEKYSKKTYDMILKERNEKDRIKLYDNFSDDDDDGAGTKSEEWDD